MKRFSVSPSVAALILAVVLFLLSGFLPNSYGSDVKVAVAQATNIVRLAVFLGVIAAGQTLVIISGGEGIDLSVGAVVTLGAIIVFRIVDGDNSMVLPALAACLAAGAIIGLINGLGVTVIRIPPLVMTLGMAGVVQGIILVVTQGELIGGPAPIMSTLISRPLVWEIPGVVIIWLLVGLIMWAVLERTTYGKQLFAVGVNRTTARLSGVRTPLIVLATFTLSGMLAALGGFMVLGFTGSVFLNLGDRYLFPSIAAVVVGGTVLAGGAGSYWGTMSGALVLTLITSLLTALQLPESYRLMVLGVILLVLLSVYGRQRGLRQ